MRNFICVALLGALVSAEGAEEAKLLRRVNKDRPCCIRPPAHEMPEVTMPSGFVIKPIEPVDLPE